MSKQWHILIVLDEEYLNRNIVHSLQIDGYFVKGVSSATEAVHLLWAEEYDIVISDQKMPDSDGFELLQWMRTYRPSTRMIMIGMPGSSVVRTQALESGAVSYLEKPLDLHALKEELRRLLQHTGFSASLDSFDLLDVIQMVNMSHKTIAMVVNTGLEEQGLLGFRAGELVWAEYGILRGEEAFFALAAHKNGTISHQHWNAQVRPNVTQPLSRLIFKALQYRSKYAEFQQLTGEQAVLSSEAVSQVVQSQDDEDTPFLFVEPVLGDGFQQSSSSAQETPVPVPALSNESIEWWQESPLQEPSHQMNTIPPEIGSPSLSVNVSTKSEEHGVGDSNSVEPGIIPTKAHKTSAGQRTDLPAWLIDQPTQFEIPALRPSSLSGSSKVPVAPNGKTNSPEKHAKPPASTTIAEQSQAEKSSRTPSYRQNSSNWKPKEKPDVGQLQSLTSIRRTDDFSTPPVQLKSSALPASVTSPSLTTDYSGGDRATVKGAEGEAPSELTASKSDIQSRVNQKRNYASLTTAVQTLGYSLSGFIATALVNIDGHPIAQVAVDNQDISRICQHFSQSMQGVLRALEAGTFGQYEDTIITSLTHFILFRLVGSSKDIFQVLVVTRDTDPVECLEMMANIEPVLEAAL